MTATRKWSVGAALVAVLILVAGWFLLVSPKRAEVADLEAQTQTQLNENSTLETEKAVLEQQFKELPEKQAQLAAIEEQLPDAVDMPSYIRELQDLANQSNVVLTGMMPAAPVTVGGGDPVTAGTGALTPDALAGLNIDIKIEGYWGGVKQFVNGIEKTERYTLVGGLTVNELDDSEGAPNDWLGATLNARIYLVPTASTTVESIPGAEATPAPSTTPAP